MNREAVALGTPVFTTFEGRLGAVDEGLLRDGRLRRLEDPAQVTGVKRSKEGPDRIRRDPRELVNMLLSADPDELTDLIREGAPPGPGGRRRLPDRAGLLPGLRPALRLGRAQPLRGAAHRHLRLRGGDEARGVRAVRALLQALALRRPEGLRVAGQGGGGLQLRPDRRPVPPLARRHQPAARRHGARLPAHAGLLRQRPLPRARAGGAPARPAGAVGRPRGADRRRRQRRPAGGAPSCAATPSCPPLRSASSTTTRASRACASPGSRCSAPPDDLARVLDDTQPSEVVIAIPSAPGVLRQKVVTACRSRDIPVRTLPTTFELLSGGVNLVRQVRELKVEDVLGREPVRVELDRVGAYLRGQHRAGHRRRRLDRLRALPPDRPRVARAAGAGGERRELAVRDRARAGGGAPLRPRACPVLADVKDATRMGEIFEEHQPSVVFHAAAYKHVGLMEENPVEAVRNNAVATRIVAAAAGEAGVERFVLVSTDKAVAPATVMGASKALAEWAVEAAQHRYRSTSYAAVRFGNVLGSSGSVVPIFRRQIAAGGPVTVTDEKMTRYFMTIPEAVQLIIRSGELAAGGRGLRARDGRPGEDRRPGAEHDPAGRPGARRGHRRRGDRPAARREDPRGPVQPRRAPAAHAGGEDRLRAAAVRRTPSGSRRPSCVSRSWSTRATPRPWRARWPSSRPSAA